MNVKIDIQKEIADLVISMYAQHVVQATLDDSEAPDFLIFSAWLKDFERS